MTYTPEDRKTAAQVLGEIFLTFLEGNANTSPTIKDAKTTHDCSQKDSESREIPEQMINQSQFMAYLAQELNGGKLPSDNTFRGWITNGTVPQPTNAGSGEKAKLWPEHVMRMVAIRLKRERVWP